MTIEIWDARTINLAPTCHRNVHWWVVTLMKTVQTSKNDLLSAWQSLTKQYRRLPKEATVAYTGIQRFQAIGGSIAALIDAGEWGES